jgi:hypothetical protein
MLADAFADPLAAQSGALLAAAFIIALASILLFYLFKPKHRLRFAQVRFREGRYSDFRRREKVVLRSDLSGSGAPVGLPYGRRATDHVRADP